MHGAGRVVGDVTGTPIRMMGIGMDITERRHAEEERAQLIREQAARHEAEQLSRAKDEFLAILSHELRTPLNAALGWAHMLRELPPGDPRVFRATDAIYRNLFVQARLVSDIMDVSRIARGTLLLERGRVDVAAVIDAAADMVRDAATARRIVIETEAPQGCALVADAKRLQQVLWNLLSNAVKFGRESGRVRISARADAGALRIAVEDDGPGIAPEFLPHVFEQFRQADASPTRRHDGLGLGLAIARHIVEQHGGTIEAGNRPGGGASFVISLPMSVGAPMESPQVNECST
jgi:signal transduction histidine kinase